MTKQQENSTSESRVTLRSIIAGALLAGLFAFLTVFVENRKGNCPTANQLPLFPYIMLVLLVLVINPIIRLIRFIKPYTLVELMVIFVMAMVSSGVSTFGLTGQLIPIIGGLYNRHWNNSQTEWNRYVEPFINESFFISEPGIRKAATEYAKAASELAQHKAHLPKHEEAEQWTAEAKRLEDVATEKRAALAELEQRAFDKVEIYRRGLPKDKRAFPGILYTPDDTPHTYFRRLGRLCAGRKAAAILRGVKSSPNQTQALAEAIELLKPYADNSDSLARTAALNAVEEADNLEIQSIDERLFKANQDKRVAHVVELRRLESEIESLDRRREHLVNHLEKLSVKRERISLEEEICARVKKACDGLTAVKENWSSDSSKQVEELLATFPSFDASLSRYLIGEVPWSHWAKPLLYWSSIILLTYLLLYTFNILIFRQWAYHEKLIFPLAELPETIAGYEGGKDTTGILPALFRNGLFWVGFAIAGGVMGWNLLCFSEAVPGLTPLDLNNSWTPFIRTSMFQGLCYGARSAVMFTLVGLAFLIPQKVSFSLWFFHIFYFILLLGMVAFGYGQNESSFPTEWWYTHNFKTALGTGALLVFASLVLWKCKEMLLCAVRPNALGKIGPDENRELRIASGLFLFSFAALIICLWKLLGVNLFYAVFGVCILMVTTIGLIRAVAEGGVLGFQSHASPFHIMRDLFGMDKAFTSPSLFAPLIVYYSIMFLDIKAFIAPAMANGLKIRDDMKMERKRYHLGIVLAIAISIFVAFSMVLIFCYDAGADAMSGWFYTAFPKSTFALIGNISKVPPMSSPSARGWLIFGALLMGTLLYFRQNNFWLPHPIGLIMLINPLMASYWFSIFLGWLAKSLVTKYANKETYAKVRGLFIGLIVGEFLVVMLALIVATIFDCNTGNITLNR